MSDADPARPRPVDPYASVPLSPGTLERIGTRRQSAAPGSTQHPPSHPATPQPNVSPPAAPATPTPPDPAVESLRHGFLFGAGFWLAGAVLFVMLYGTFQLYLDVRDFITPARPQPSPARSGR